MIATTKIAFLLNVISFVSLGSSFVFVFVVTPYNHRTYYNELLKSGRQVKDSFYAYVGEGGSF